MTNNEKKKMLKVANKKFLLKERKALIKFAKKVQKDIKESLSK